MTKRGDYYYIMCAEGGTGYYHSVTMGRSKNIWGPYEPDPCNPILTSSPVNKNERANWDHLKPHYYNPDSKLQNLVMQVMWNFKMGKYGWFILQPDLLHRSFAVPLDVKLQSRE